MPTRLRRTKGTGSIVTRATGRRELRWTRADGSHASRAVPADMSDRDAAALLARLVAGTEPERRRPLPASAGPETVAQYLARWTRQREASGAARQTVRAYRGVAKRLAPLIGAIPLATLTRAEVQDAVYEMNAARTATGAPRFAPSTVRQARAILRAALNEAEDLGLISRNPTSRIRLPALPRPDPPRIDVRAVLAAVADDPIAGVCQFGGIYGVRISEALGLRRVDIDEAAGAITIRGQLDADGATYRPQTKGRLHRVLPMLPEASALLRAAALQQKADRLRAGGWWRETGFVFTREDGRPFSQDMTRARLHACMDAAGLPRVHFHAFRHSAIARMRRAGVDEAVRRAIVGHASSSIHSGYGDVDLDDLRRALGETWRAATG